LHLLLFFEARLGALGFAYYSDCQQADPDGRYRFNEFFLAPLTVKWLTQRYQRAEKGLIAGRRDPVNPGGGLTGQHIV
jgi:hypothetical protein